jgi:murein L,D-transpeptidase YcbB/YkuD
MAGDSGHGLLAALICIKLGWGGGRPTDLDQGSTATQARRLTTVHMAVRHPPKSKDSCVRCRVLLLLILFLAPPAVGSQSTATAESAGAGTASPAQQLPVDALRALLSSGVSPLSQIGGGRFALLQRFYAARGYAPLWTGISGLSPKGAALLARLRKIAAAGQSSALPLLAEAASRAPARGGRPMAELELLLSASLVSAAIDPTNPVALAERPQVLAEVAKAEDPLSLLQGLLPIDPAFWRLRGAMQAYRGIEANGGWPRVPPGPKLELGVRGPRVALLRQRLLVTGDLRDMGTQADSFDEAVDAAVRRFQARHGLQVDGVVGVNTLAALNLSVAERLATMDINLRRLQRQHREWGERYVVVNAAAASYRLVDRGQPIFERAAIVGRRGWPTPQLDSVIDRLEFNPYWVVPPRIARLEVLPKIRRDPGYMLRNDMHWVNGQIRQNPGPKNPLGKVKFLFLNPYDIYLHDTSSPQLFERWDRFLSHGCMRVAVALDLARYLLKDDPQWPPQRIQEVLDSGETVRVRLAATIPLHVVYDTAWVDDAGVMNLRSDVYGRDGSAGAPVAEADNRNQRCAA